MARGGPERCMRPNWIVKPMPNSMLNMLLNLPEKSISRSAFGDPVDRPGPQVRAVGLGEDGAAEARHVHDEDAHQREAAHDVERRVALGWWQGSRSRRNHRRTFPQRLVRP